jgi:predicted ArsR family transcriptional regulator
MARKREGQKRIITDDAIVGVVQARGRASVDDVAGDLDCHRTTVLSHIGLLVRRGRLDTETVVEGKLKRRLYRPRPTTGE